jgi:phenylalanyl-tRNA synthetase beta subunit
VPETVSPGGFQGEQNDAVSKDLSFWVAAQSVAASEIAENPIGSAGVRMVESVPILDTSVNLYKTKILRITRCTSARSPTPAEVSGRRLALCPFLPSMIAPV